ncbi:MAG: radical SAM protein [Thermoanaerobaculia bacterium]|nr:radical SAM protein [Thermoanaerobaculia bacterium]
MSESLVEIELPPASSDAPPSAVPATHLPTAASTPVAVSPPHRKPLPEVSAKRSLLREQMVLLRLALRVATELSPRALWKMLYLYAAKGAGAIWAYKRRLAKGELYPPFLFIAITNSCNLRCHGCWVEKEGEGHVLGLDEIDLMIESGKRRKSYYYTLLGGEPFLVKDIWKIFETHSDCYFQTITNGMIFTEANVERLKRLGNVTPLVSLDGFEQQNDLRRGDGVWQAAMKGLERLKEAKLFYGIATTATGLNLEEVMSDEYVEYFIERGAMYIWYYVYRPMSPEPHTEYCVSEEQLLWLRRRLLELRRKHPILIIDTYWTADGEAFCPAATGLGFHIGPKGSIEICPALSFATDNVQNHQDDLWDAFDQNDLLRTFQGFVQERTKGCVILENPQELHDQLRELNAQDTSGRDTAFDELNALTPRHSHHLPGREVPEDFWFYRLLKKNVFFGMGAIG